jgi:hypothetical protein
MKIIVEAPRQKKKTSFNAQDVNLMDTQIHTVQNHMHALNAEETITQPYVQNHQIYQPSVHCVEETIPQATKDVKCRRICKKNRGKPINQIAHRPTQQRINVSDNSQFPLINPNQTSIQMPLAPQISYSQALQQNQQPLYIPGQFSVFLTEFKKMFNQLINQNSMILSLLNTVINKITTNR